MGRRKNNPNLVEELIRNLWTLDHDDWDEKYESLSSSDKHKVAGAVHDMEKEYFADTYADERTDDDDW